MSFAQHIIFGIFVIALYIYMGCSAKETELSIYDPTPEMLLNMVKKTPKGWFCAGVYCPKDYTSSCKTTSILRPTVKIDYDLVVLCLNATNAPICGVTRSGKVIVQEIVEVDNEGNFDFVKKERLNIREGISVPHCTIKGKPIG